MSTDVVPAPGLVDQLYAELEQKILALRPKEDLTLLEKAFHRAADAHKDQLRDSGEPYMIHPLHVTMILADMQMDMVCLNTGLLHDTVEDTSLSLEQIKKEFGHEVAACVDGVTKLSKLKLYSREERQAESVRKMLLAMVNDIRVIIVKLADRLHNMRTLDALPRERQLRIAQETAEIYAPIAHRLGMGKVRGELEDLSFRYLEPEAWAELMREIESQRGAERRVSHQDAARCGSESAAREHPGARGGAHQAAILGVPEDEAAEDRAGSGVRSARPAHHHRFGEELLRGAGRDPQRMASRFRDASRTSSRFPAPIFINRCTRR